MKRARARTGLRGQLLLLIGACAGAASLAGCYDTNPCRAEVCDGKDNDCDGAIDDGFIDEFGLYSSDEHCGACALSCSNVFPGAQTSCMSSADGAPRCVIDACPPGERLIPDGTCVPELNVQCMACDGDAECETFAPGARCLRSESGGGHCGMPCSGPGDCDRGFNCVEDGGGAPQCQPATSTCACTEALVGARFGCLLHNADGDACAGVQRCEASGLGACVPALEERCNGIDDDCDDRADEDFVDDRGRYLSAEHCGECGKACVAPGPFMQANCLADRAGARCEAECLTDHVDLDQLLVTGCECQLMSGPGVVIGADADCDGVIDETPEFIFVSAGGDDDNAGDDAGAPVRSLARGLARGRETGRTVLVARGIYTGPVALEPGVTLLGGYSPDFRQRDVALFPVSIEADPAQPGAPVLHCADLREPAVVDGLTVLGGDATVSGEGSTAVFLDGCGPELVLKDVVVVAGRGAAGLPGADSTANLAPLGLNSLADLDGVNGGQGTAGDPSGASCSASPAGAGGGKSCPSGATSGGDGGASQCTDLSLVCDNLSGAPCGNSGCTDYTDGNGSCDLAAARAAAIANPAAGDGSGEAPGAAGESAYASPTNRQSCNFCDDNPSLPRAGGDGGDGASGDDGRAGRGCAGLELVDFTLGRVAAGGGRDGASGLDGSGGGGATAGAGFSRIGSTNGSCTDVAGGSGGGGGSGGCGAPGADAGGGGGASLGLLIRLPDGEEAGPQLMNVRVLTSSGGDGGAGGIGAAGGPGGAGGIGGTSQFWCARDGGRGGDGGKGGDGGGGGGGCGGGSYGVYVAGAASDAYAEELRKGSVIERAGVAGQAGPGGFSPGSAGEAGLPGSVRDFVFAR